MPVENKPLDDALDEAAVAVATSSLYTPTSSEQRLNKLGDKISALTESPYASVVQNDDAASAFSAVKTQVVNFAENSRILLDALDEVAKIHPAIQVAVSLFKAALTLELTRRENDDKVLALNATMCDMMSVLTLLKGITSSKEVGTDGLSIEDRLLRRMTAAVESIKTCAKVCDSYHKRNLAIKIFTSVKWKAKFTQVAQEFADHKAGLQLDLQMYASIGVAATNDTLATMSQNVETVMGMVFELMRSPQERELSAFISSKPGGPDTVLGDNRFLEEVIAKERLASAVEDSVVAPGQPDAALTPVVLQQEVAKDPDSVMSENLFFEQKFDAMCAQLEEVRVTITHESDRVINTLLAGPHEQIVDKDIYEIWKEMGWKRSVEAKRLVLAIRDHFAAKRRVGLASNRGLIQGSHATRPAQWQTTDQTADITTDTRTPQKGDAWALQYITVARIQPLLEAIDDDGSSYVTVEEVNTFTSARPGGWSLPHWMAYWTCGLDMTFQWYYRRICALLVRINMDSHSVLPANRAPVGIFLLSKQIFFVENVLSGLRTPDGWKPTGWNWDTMFAKFHDYVQEHERQLEKRLRRVKYLIDEPNTLTSLIVEEERPETYLLPIIFFLLRRALNIVRQASKITLHPDELQTVQRSLFILSEAVRERVGSLRTVFRMQGMTSTEQLEYFSFGLYAHVFEDKPSKTSHFWRRDPRRDILGRAPFGPFEQRTPIEEELSLEADADEPPLSYGAQEEELDAVLSGRPEADDAVDSLELSDPPDSYDTLKGRWGGHTAFSSPAGPGKIGLIRLKISVHAPDGIVAGDGVDAWGPFVVRGTYADGRITFVKMSTIGQAGRRTEWYYDAKVQDDMSAMEGSWGLPQSLMRAPGYSPYYQPPTESQTSGRPTLPQTTIALRTTDPLVPHGSFALTRRPIVYFIACPPPQEFARNRPRALWSLAIRAAIHLTRLKLRRLDWSVLQSRRHRRERYIALVTKLSGDGYRLDPQEDRELEELVSATHPDDLHVWNAVGDYRARREIIHYIYRCNGCRSKSFTGSRLVCVDCAPTQMPMDTYDLCFACFSKGVHAQVPAHTFIQFRAIKMRMYQLASLLTAQDTAAQIKRSPSHPFNGGPPSCAGCKTVIAPGKSYWFCLNCPPAPTPTNVCMECNSRVEQEKPWLLQRRPIPREIHNWSHTLVLIAGISAPEPTNPVAESPSIERRFSLLEAKFDQLVANINACLEMLEEGGGTIAAGPAPPDERGARTEAIAADEVTMDAPLAQAGRVRAGTDAGANAGQTAAGTVPAAVQAVETAEGEGGRGAGICCCILA